MNSVCGASHADQCVYCLHMTLGLFSSDTNNLFLFHYISLNSFLTFGFVHPYYLNIFYSTISYIYTYIIYIFSAANMKG